jgi:hypothetical protein
MIICDVGSGTSWACDSAVASTGWAQDGTCITDGSCDTSGHVCYTGANYISDCTSCAEGNTCDSDATLGDYSADGICFNSGGLLCCDGTEDYEDAGASGDCCYNGAILNHNSISGYALCDNGALYDCNNQEAMNPAAETESTSCDNVGNYWCSYINTWEATRVAADCCPNPDGDPNSANCDQVGGEEWNHGDTSGDCDANKWLIGDYDDSGSGNDDIWGVWTQNNSYWFYILMNVSSGTVDADLRIYFDTDEDGTYECYVNQDTVRDSTTHVACSGGSAGTYATANNFAEYQIDLDDYICDTCCGGSSGDCGASTRIYVDDPNGDDRAPNSSYALYDFSDTCGGGGPNAPIPEFPFGAVVAFVILLLMTALLAPKPL